LVRASGVGRGSLAGETAFEKTIVRVRVMAEIQVPL
jgi:hypothetical protein